MNVKVPQLLTLFATLCATIGLPTLVTNWVHVHATVYLVIVGAAIVLHAVMPSVFAAPSDADKKSVGLDKVGMILLLLLFPFVLSAQQGPALQEPRGPVGLSGQVEPSPLSPTSNGFAASSDAVAVYYAGGWSAGTHVTESYDFVDFGKAKTNRLYLEGHELLAPTPGFQMYAGGVKFEPDLNALLGKTNVKAGSFGLFMRAAVGNALPASGGSHISILTGGGVKYQITQQLTWQTLQANYFRLGAQNGAAISTGLSFVFGK